MLICVAFDRHRLIFQRILLMFSGHTKVLRGGDRHLLLRLMQITLVPNRGGAATPLSLLTRVSQFRGLPIQAGGHSKERRANAGTRASVPRLRKIRRVTKHPRPGQHYTRLTLPIANISGVVKLTETWTKAITSKCGSSLTQSSSTMRHNPNTTSGRTSHKGLL